MRIGVGYDSHRFAEGIPLVLGGVDIPDHPGLLGHSDGDALVHSIIDALLGAVGEGDVGTHFPPSDQRWRGASSLTLLARIAEMLATKGWSVVNLDAVVVAESPKIAPLVESMRARLGGALSVSPDRISIKGKSNEGLGWIGAGEGLAVHAVACLSEDAGDITPSPLR